MVSFPSGYALHWDAASDTLLGAIEGYRPMNSVRMAHIGLFERETAGGVAGGSAARIYGLGDPSRVDRKRPVILDSREPLFIRAFHDQQDSPPCRRMEGELAGPEALPARLRLEGVALPSPEQSRKARREVKRKAGG